MTYSVKANMEGILVPVFLMDNGEWTEDTDKMATFPSATAALKAALNAEGQGYLIGVHISFSGWIREEFKNLPV